LQVGDESEFEQVRAEPAPEQDLALDRLVELFGRDHLLLDQKAAQPVVVLHM